MQQILYARQSGQLKGRKTRRKNETQRFNDRLRFDQSTFWDWNRSSEHKSLASSSQKAIDEVAKYYSL